MPSLTQDPSAVTCCILPLVSVKRRSRNFTSLSFMIFSTSPALFGLSAMLVPCPHSADCMIVAAPTRAVRPRAVARTTDARFSDGVGSRLAGADADRLFDGGDEYLAVADATGLRGLLDGVEGLRHHFVGQHHLDLHLGQEIDHVLGAAVKLGVSLLPAEAFRLNDGDALQTDLLQRLFHLVELEGLDNGFDLFHASLHLPTCPALSARSFVTQADCVPRSVLGPKSAETAVSQPFPAYL